MTELGGCKVTAGSDGSLEITAQFLGCDKMELNAALVSRMMQTPLGGRRGSSIMYVVIFFLYNTIQYNTVIYNALKVEDRI